MSASASSSSCTAAAARFSRACAHHAHQQYIADIEASSREALASVNPGPIFKHYGENVWAAVSAHLDAVTEHAAAPVIAKYTGVLGGADIEVYTRTTTFAIMQSIRLDRGPSGPVHP